MEGENDYGVAFLFVFFSLRGLYGVSVWKSNRKMVNTVKLWAAQTLQVLER